MTLSLTRAQFVGRLEDRHFQFQTEFDINAINWVDEHLDDFQVALDLACSQRNTKALFENEGFKSIVHQVVAHTTMNSIMMAIEVVFREPGSDDL